MATEPDTIMIGGVKYWIKRPYRTQPQSDHTLPECENPHEPPSGHTVFGRYSRRGPEKPVVRMVYDIMARGR